MKKRIDALHGLRGLACLIVFNAHVIGNLTANAAFGFGSEDIFVLSQLPLVRLWSLGTTAVSILLAVSGYCLSYGPLTQAYVAKDTYGVSRRLISASVRRPLRLYLPALANLLFCGFCSWIGLFEASRSAFGDDNEIYFLAEMPPPRFDSFGLQLRNVTNAWVDLMSLNKYANNNPPMGVFYNPHLWTIPLEFQTSMLLFLALLCASQIRPLLGQALLLLCIIQAFLYARWEVLCMFGGSLLAMTDILHGSKASQPSHEDPNPTLQIAELSTAKELFALIMGGLLLSTPVRDSSVDEFYPRLPKYLLHPGYDESAYLRAVGALLMVWIALRSPRLCTILKSKYLQYIGDISFSFYLVHGIIIRCIFHTAIPWVYTLTGDGTYDGQDGLATVVAWAIGVCICLPPTILLAEWWQKFINAPITRFLYWLSFI